MTTRLSNSSVITQNTVPKFHFCVACMFCGQGAAFRVKLPSGIQQYS
jgi:hypothetical protein